MNKVLKEDFHKDYQKFAKNEGKTLRHLSILNDLYDLYEKMDKFTEEEAIVQLLHSYKRRGFNTSLLLKFRDIHKNLLRWIRERELIIDPQQYIDYDKNDIIVIKDQDLINKILSSARKHNNGKTPERFYVLHERRNIMKILNENLDVTFASIEDDFLRHIGKIKKELLSCKSYKPTDLLDFISKNEEISKSLKVLSTINSKIFLNKESLLTIGYTKSSDFSFAHIDFSDKRNIETLKSITNDLIKTVKKYYKDNNNERMPLNSSDLMLDEATVKKLICKIFLNVFLFKNNKEDFTEREIVAIYLHEVGHLYGIKQSILLSLYQYNDSYFLRMMEKINDEGINNVMPSFSKRVKEKLTKNRSKLVINSHDIIADNFTRNYDYQEDLRTALEKIKKILITQKSFRSVKNFINITFIDPTLNNRIRTLKTDN